MSFTLNGQTYTPQTATQHAQNMLADMNNQLNAAGLPTLTASQANAMWWTLLAQGTENANNDLALQAAANSMNIALCDDNQILNLLPTMGSSLIPASPSSVTLTITATASGATIPAGSLAVSGPNFFSTIQAITIPASGTATVGATCTANGPITAAIGTITSFSPTVTGVATVNNATAALPGRNLETVAQARVRLLAGGAIMSQQQGAIFALQSLPGITQANVLFNVSATTALTLIGVGSEYPTGLAPRTALILVVGDNAAQIGPTYMAYMNAPTQVGSVTNKTSIFTTGSVGTIQTITVNYEQAVNQSIWINVQIVSTPAVVAALTSITAQIQNVITALNGQFQIGAKISAAPFYAAFQGFSQAQVLGITMSLDNITYGNTVIPNTNGYPTLANANISVTLV
jgi:hypothetical protein